MKDTLTAAVVRAHFDEPYRQLVEGVRDYAIFLLDPQGHILTWNQGAELIKGYKPAEIIGKHFSVFYPQSALDKGWPQHELDTAKRLGRFEDEGWRVRQDGTRFWANVVITPLRNDEGQHIGFSKITRDLSERRAAEERLRLSQVQLRESEEKFRLLVEGIEDYAICMLDLDGRVTSWNAGAQRITGYRADEIIGQSFERFYPPEDVAAGLPVAEIRTAMLNRRVEEQGWRVRKDGTRFWADVVVTALHDDTGQLRGFAKVTRDLSERKRMESLEEQGRHLTEFVAMLAHELRNPLAPIRNALGIMGVIRDTPPQIAWCRDVIERQTVHLTRLVDDLLDVSRITRGKLRLQGETMDVNVAVQRAIEAARPLIDARRHSLQAMLPPDPIPINGDMTRVTQVIINLLNNAAKYTPEGGRLSIDVHSEADDVVIRVKDNGVGMPPQLLDHVFDLFAQGERTIDRSEGGLGIGLTIARRLAALHGGSITAHSEGAGKGSEFVLRLPRLNLDVYAADSVASEMEVSATSQKRKLLVVDDNPDAAESMAMLLRMIGHEVEIEYDGRAALERISANAPDILLLDIGLPGMSGYEVARALRARPEGQALKIFAMTGYGQEEDRRKSLEAGFDGHLVKPVMPGELFALIDGTQRAI